MPVIIDGTSGVTPASWTTANRPTSPSVGQQGWNTDLQSLECWSGSNWEFLDTGGAINITLQQNYGGF